MEDNKDYQKLNQLTDKPYEEQCAWFLNAFWSDLEAEAPKVWNYYLMIALIDEANGIKGCKIQQLDAHRFLEKTNNPQTYVEYVNTLRGRAKKDKNDKTFSLIEYLFFIYNVDLHKLVNAPQNSNTEEMAKAQAICEESDTKLKIALSKAESAKNDEKKQLQTEADVDRACNALKKEEDDYNRQTEKYKFDSDDSSKGIVFRKKANHQLAEHLEKGTSEVRRAKINQEAALRKAKVATEAAVKSKEEAVAALRDAEKAFEDAQKSLDEMKKLGGSGQGTIYMIERKLEENKKYLPQSRGGK